jgi:DNA-binding transcriptional MerR regulator
VSERPALPLKLYYRIGEVANVVGVETHVLRYWESEFPTIRPQKSAKGHRVYSRRDVEKLIRVKQLLYSDGYTVQGAKRKLQEFGRNVPAGPALSATPGVTTKTLVETKSQELPVPARETLATEPNQGDAIGLKEIADAAHIEAEFGPSLRSSELGPSLRSSELGPSLRSSELSPSLRSSELSPSLRSSELGPTPSVEQQPVQTKRPAFSSSTPNSVETLPRAAEPHTRYRGALEALRVSLLDELATLGASQH